MIDIGMNMIVVALEEIPVLVDMVAIIGIGKVKDQIVI